MQRFRRQRIIERIWRRVNQLFCFIRNFMLISLFVMLMISLIIAGMFYREFTRIPKVKDQTLLVMNMKGVILDGPSFNAASQRILGEDVQTMRGVVTNIRKATADSRIIGMLFKMDSYGMGYAVREEIQEELLKFKEAGKKIFVYTEFLTPSRFLFAGIADGIYLLPSGSAYFAAFTAEIPYYRGLLDKIGITPEHSYIGKYKSGPQPEMFEKIPDAPRESTTFLLDSYYNAYVEQIAEARRVSPEIVKGWLDRGFYAASEALEAGIVDKLLYKDELEKELKVELGLIEETEETNEASESAALNAAAQEEDAEDAEEEGPELPQLNNSQYARVKVKIPDLHNKGRKVAVIYATGIILSGKSSPIGSSAPMIGADSMTELLKSLEEDDDIEGIILRVNSPGGGAKASDLIRRALQQVKEKKPIIISMSNLAASGGYMISAPGDTILAYPFTLTGSIGIYSQKYSFQKLHQMLGINTAVISRSQNSGIFSPFRNRSPEESERMMQYLRVHYNHFVEGVAQGRGMSFEEVDAVAQGRVWYGLHALENGLVDRLGGFDEAVTLMKEKLEIPEDQDIQLLEYPRLGNPLNLLWQRFLETRLSAHIPDEILAIKDKLEIITRLQNEAVLLWEPQHINVME
ncbi:MAG: signal peptide peptidase SppA [bacterium]|nr:signal peptide peptidase SppA [bacterium]